MYFLYSRRKTRGSKKLIDEFTGDVGVYTSEKEALDYIAISLQDKRDKYIVKPFKLNRGTYY